MDKSPSSFKKALLQGVWEAFCLASIVGIWPRYIERKLLWTSQVRLPIPNLAKGLVGARVVHFSDLHFCANQSPRFLAKISRRIRALDPDILTISGDFLCHASIYDPDALLHFLRSLHARHGTYTVFGNHDYDKYLSINSSGDYDAITHRGSSLLAGFRRLFKKQHLSHRVSDQARTANPHPTLMQLLKSAGIQALRNDSVQVDLAGERLNICGLGEYWAGDCQPKKAFADWDVNYPGIVLAHNPDVFTHLGDYPGSIVLCGHTHGGQVNLPWLWKRFVSLENPEYKRGMTINGKRRLYVNRGIGAAFPLRCFSVPELLCITLADG